jgi:HdeA/HdeB family protein
MTSKITIAALAAFLVASQAVQPIPAKAASPQLPEQMAAAPKSTSAAQTEPGKWDVARVQCADLLNAADDDRASAAMFYYGYLTAKYGIRVIDVTKISDNIKKVMEQCEKTPKMHVTQAFSVAIPHHK